MIFSNTLIIEELLNDRFTKSAQDGLAASLVDKVKNYAEQHIDPNNKAASILEILTPGMLTAFGFTWLAVIYELASSVFNINLASIFSSIKSGIASLIANDKQTDSSSVENVINSAFSSVKTSFTLEDAQLFKQSLNNFVNQYPNFSTIKPKFEVKLAASMFGVTKFKIIQVLIKVVKWIVITLLASAGFLIAKDTANSLVSSKPVKNDKVENIQSEQIHLTVNPSYSSENFNNTLSSWTIPGNINSIEQIIISWAKEIYPQLKEFEALIKSTSSFNQLISTIKAYNDGNNLGFISIPKQFKSRKQLVDVFIKEIENKISKG